MRRLLPLEEAIRQVLRRAGPRRSGRVPLGEAAGLRLAAAVRADRDQPPFHRATVDGYAISSSDPAAKRGRPFRVVETVLAGETPRIRVRRGDATLVMTGAPVPSGADAVVKREDAELLNGGDRVRLPDCRAGAGVHRRGSDARRGGAVLAAGTPVTPRAAGVLASLGAVRPRVFLPPRVAVAVTGDEVRPASVRRLPPAAIRNSNGPTLEALVRAAGGVPVILGTSGDRQGEIRDLLRRGLAAAEVVVVSGGVSMGDRDLVPAAMRAAGVRRVFHGVDLRPGKPIWFGVRGRRLVFGLPGNPVSAQVTFALLVAPALAALRGEPDPLPRRLEARLSGRAPREGGRTAYRPARVRRGPDGRLLVRLVPWHGSGDFVNFARADALVIRRARAPAAKAGARVEVLLLDPA